MNIQAINTSNNITFGKSNKPKKERNRGGLRAYFASGLVAAAIPAKSISLKIFESMRETNKLSAEDLSKVHSALNKTMKDSGLLNKGVELIKIKDINPEKLSLKKVINYLTSSKVYDENKRAAAILENVYKEHLSKDLKYKALNVKQRGKIAKTLSERYILMLQKGMNAFYLGKANKILIPETKLALSGFHEAGHAMNRNFSKIGKALQNNKKIKLLAPIFLLIGAFGKNKKDKDNKTKNKTVTFIRNNAGKLTFATFLPILIEEGMATVKGNRMAKEALDKNLAAKVSKTNRVAYMSYLLTAVIATISTFTAVKVKDRIQNKHNKKVALRNESF